MFPFSQLITGGGGADREDTAMRTHRPCPICGQPMPAAVAPIEGRYTSFYICPMGVPVAETSPIYPLLFVMGLPEGSQHTEPGPLWNDAELDRLQRVQFTLGVINQGRRNRRRRTA